MRLLWQAHKSVFGNGSETKYQTICKITPTYIVQDQFSNVWALSTSSAGTYGYLQWSP
jgi:hypothetical protein